MITSVQSCLSDTFLAIAYYESPAFEVGLLPIPISAKILGNFALKLGIFYFRSWGPKVERTPLKFAPYILQHTKLSENIWPLHPTEIEIGQQPYRKIASFCERTSLRKLITDLRTGTESCLRPFVEVLDKKI